MSDLRERILQTLQGGPQTLEEIGLDILSYPNDWIRQAIGLLINEGKVGMEPLSGRYVLLNHADTT